MTPEAQRIAIAEACGWRDCKTADSIGRVITKTIVGTNDELQKRGQKLEERGLPNWPYSVVSDPLNDLNAMHQAWLTLNESERFNFREHCRDIAGREKIWWEEAIAKFGAEAFLRTIGKWEETE
jgi:hypothetical protein